jgi:hypothetical protein
MKDKVAGNFSGDLLAALGMVDRDSAPPPWLINMQVVILIEYKRGTLYFKLIIPYSSNHV